MLKYTSLCAGLVCLVIVMQPLAAFGQEFAVPDAQTSDLNVYNDQGERVLQVTPQTDATMQAIPACGGDYTPHRRLLPRGFWKKFFWFTRADGSKSLYEEVHDSTGKIIKIGCSACC